MLNTAITPQDELEFQFYPVELGADVITEDEMAMLNQMVAAHVRAVNETKESIAEDLSALRKAIDKKSKVLQSSHDEQRKALETRPNNKRAVNT